MVAKYLSALIFCGARSSCCLILAAASMAGFPDCRFAGSAIAFSGGLGSRWGLFPRRFDVAPRSFCHPWGTPMNLQSVAGPAPVGATPGAAEPTCIEAGDAGTGVVFARRGWALATEGFARASVAIPG